MFYTLVNNGDEANITVFIPGHSAPLAAHSSHPNWDKIVQAVVSPGPLYDPQDIEELFDVSIAVAKKFEALSDDGRITVANGNVFLDGDAVDNSLTKQIVRFLNEGVNDWEPLVLFMEKVESNPNEHSRSQLYRWLERHDFTITPEGNFVGYKGVAAGPDPDTFLSIHSGVGIVDGEQVNGRIPNRIGSTVEIPRSLVHHDPSVGCSTGLHVGTYSYAKGYAQGALLEVHVNPRDVVSVPTDCEDQKVRVCRYVIVDTLDAPYATAVTEDDDWDYDDEFEFDLTCDGCGDYTDACSCEEDEPEDEPVELTVNDFEIGERVKVVNDVFGAAGKVGTVAKGDSPYYVSVDVEGEIGADLYAPDEIEKLPTFHGHAVGERWRQGWNGTVFEVVERPSDPGEYGYREGTIPVVNTDTGDRDGLSPYSLEQPNSFSWFRVN